MNEFKIAARAIELCGEAKDLEDQGKIEEALAKMEEAMRLSRNTNDRRIIHAGEEIIAHLQTKMTDKPTIQ